MMSKDPSELNMMSKDGVSEATAKLFWKFFVLNKYGGILTDRNFMLRGDIDRMR